MHLLNRVLLVSAGSLAAASLAQAQSLALGSPVSASGSFVSMDSLDRAALYTQSAFTAPQGRFGFTVQAVGTSGKIEDGDGEISVRGAGAAFSGFYGVTNAITLGAGLPYQSVTTELSVGGIGAEDNTDGFGDAELFARMRAFRSVTGATKLALGAGMTLPTGDDAFTYDDPTYRLGAAMTHRADRMSFHVAPEVSFVKEFDPSYNLNVAASFAATPKLALSVESLNRFMGNVDGDSSERGRMFDLGAGLRYNAVDNLLLDLGLRTNLSNNAEDVDLSAGGLTFGFNWLF